MFESLKKAVRNLLKPQTAAAPKTGKKSAQSGRSGTPREKSARGSRAASSPAAVAKPAARTRRTPEKRQRRTRDEEPQEALSGRAAEAIAARTAHQALPLPTEPLKIAREVEGKLRFTDLALAKEVLYGVQSEGFEYCTPIQALAFPLLLKGRDIAGKAQTGTGKTAAFLLTLFTRYLANPAPAQRRNGTPRALILAPTRELAIQIHHDAETLGKYVPLTSVVVFGGMDHEKQRRELEQPVDLVIGTPGRVIDYSRSGSLNLRHVETLVIDEADRMLDMGFIPDVKRIVGQLPPKGERQTMLFSATLEEKILRLASGWLVDPAVVESEPEKLVSENITQTFYSVLREEKLALLLYLLKHESYDRVLIFGNRKDVNLRLQYDLAKYGYQVPVLSGDITQDKRIRILERFRTGVEKIVIATDVAARGIHVDDVSLVINFDLPERPEDYVHRIGRTGRAGHQGKSVSFLCEYGAYYLPAIEEMLKVQFPSTLPTEEMVTLPPPVEGAKLPAFPERERRPRRSGSRFFGSDRRRMHR